MMISDLKTLVLDPGNLASLAATACLPRPERAVLWHPVGGDPAAGRRQAAICEKAAHFAIPEIVEPSVGSFISVAMGPGREGALMGPDEVCLLVQSVKEAATRGLEQVLWPVHGSGSVEEAGRACEIAILVNHLADLVGSADGPMKIALPFLDFSPNQILDLVLQSEAPLHLWWECEHGTETPCGGCPACLHWTGVFEAASVIWPWSRTAMPA